jgi:peptidoglycan-associated lipoprotein
MNKTIFLAVLVAVFLVGCSSTGGSKQGTSASVEDRSGSASSTGSSATPYGIDENSGTGMSALDDPQSLLYERTIYFEYDSSEIQAPYRALIEAHALYLVANPNVIVTLEGHADERGSREYNLALGERRSLSAKRQMVLLGAGSAQIRTVSYGEERPLETGHDEYSWSRNRRVEILY